MTRTDRAALKLAVAVARGEDAGRAEQMNSKLKTEPWEEVARFCSTVCQSRSLRLMPWQLAPCDVFPGEVETSAYLSAPAAYALQQQMLKLGISKYHPDPLQAIADAERGAASA